MKTKKADFNNDSKKIFTPSFFIITSILVAYFLANLVRNFSVDEIYLKHPFRKFFIW